MINTTIFSKGLYSNWCYNQTYQTLFDCGEGCATHLANVLPGVERIFIGHDHADHTLGLPSLIGCRNAAQGTSREKGSDHNKPLNIYYPEDNRLMDGLFSFCEQRYADWLRYRLNLIPIKAGFELQLGKDVYVRAFNMKHQKNQTTLGYVIYQNRSRLKAEYREFGPKIGDMIKSGEVNASNITEVYRANIFAYCLDAYDIPDADQISGCDNVIMDCTFIDEKDRTDSTHFSLDEAKELCHSVKIKNMYAAHFSSRYDFNRVVADNPDVKFINPYIINKI